MEYELPGSRTGPPDNFYAEAIESCRGELTWWTNRLAEIVGRSFFLLKSIVRVTADLAGTSFRGLMHGNVNGSKPQFAAGPQHDTQVVSEKSWNHSPESLEPPQRPENSILPTYHAGGRTPTENRLNSI